jgi:hypothetical protein
VFVFRPRSVGEALRRDGDESAVSDAEPERSAPNRHLRRDGEHPVRGEGNGDTVAIRGAIGQLLDTDATSIATACALRFSSRIV